MLKLNQYIYANLAHPSVFSLPVKFFYEERFVNKYKFNYRSYREGDRIFKQFANNMFFMCDTCGVNMSERKKFYSSSCGDICPKCYNNKMDIKMRRIKHLKSKIRLVGRQAIFKKELERIRELLQHKKPIKLTKNKKIQLMTNSINQYKKTHRQCVCKICLDVLDFGDNNDHLKQLILFELNKGNTNISIGSLCGHTFHTTCLQEITTQMCPYCRIETKFTRLFL